MEPFIIHRVATVAVLPLAAAGGWGYTHHPPQYQPPAACIVISANLSYGSESSDVALLQHFLMQEGYLRGNTTGYFGRSTQTALTRFQRDEGLPTTGVVDSRTRDRIEELSCGYRNYRDEYREDYSSDYSYRSNDPYYQQRSGCTNYYDRSCYQDGSYVGPYWGGGSTYNGPGDTCYYLNGRWQGSCGDPYRRTEYDRYDNRYQYQDSYARDYRCYYDRTCLARMDGY